ncbi:MAG: four helix bundle protein [Acidobacteria bacterium]|nr:four helix bundle protein [Acidobacteriota bacterium]MBK7933953.1 four helix bundle protein [Acidobacteriota bacterium]
MKDFRTLSVWHKSHGLTLRIYEITRSFPKEELFGLTSQIRRASSSISANIAEGCGRDSDGDFQRFLQIAFGSVNEVDYHLLLAFDLKIVDEVTYRELLENVIEIKRMLSSLIRKVRMDR